MNTTLIGSGVAAWTLVRELRKASPDADICLITADSGDFYSKPMLSNALASGKTAAQLVMTPASKLAAQHNVQLLAHTTVLSINPEHNTLRTDTHTLEYGQLVLALGADPITLPINGDGHPDVLRVNDLNDYAAFRARLEGKSNVAILGAGLIGCEFANDLLKANIQTTVFDLANRPLARLLPEEGSAHLQNTLEALGACWKLGRTITHIQKEAEHYVITDSTGETTTAELVLSALGLTPRTHLAKAAGLDVKQGIVINALGQTSNPNIYALGDCAQYAGHYVLPYIMPVMQAARAIAQTLSGNPTPIQLPAMPVLVKTPDCPMVISPPLPEQHGTWEITNVPNGLKALFKSPSGQLLGMALMGQATQERQTLAPQLPALI